MKIQAETQKQWVYEQKYEKQMNNHAESEEEKYISPISLTVSI
jgi:hypothetical protein